jgi:hypothetical protein
VGSVSVLQTGFVPAAGGSLASKAVVCQPVKYFFLCRWTPVKWFADLHPILICCADTLKASQPAGSKSADKSGGYHSDSNNNYFT